MMCLLRVSSVHGHHPEGCYKEGNKTMADYFRHMHMWNQNTFQKNVEQHLKYYTNDKFFANEYFSFLVIICLSLQINLYLVLSFSF